MIPVVELPTDDSVVIGELDFRVVPEVFDMKELISGIKDCQRFLDEFALNVQLESVVR
jgi:hypothetical protein